MARRPDQSAMRAVLAAPDIALAPVRWAAFWAAYAPGTPPPRSPVARFAEEQAQAAEDALTAATAASSGVRVAVARTYTRSYWLEVYGRVERDALAGRQVRYLVSLAAPGWEVDPAWRTSDVLALAKGIVATGDFAVVPVLADALQDAGCDDEEWLAILRDPAQPWFAGARVLETLR